MPRERRKPPISKMINGEPTEAPTCSGVSTPVNGNMARGSNDVTGIGIGSKIHQAMHSQATTAVIIMAGECPADCSIKPNPIAVARPGHTVFLGSR
jgi:hypothetical protein